MADKWAIKKGNCYYWENKSDQGAGFSPNIESALTYDTWQEAKDDMEFLGHYHIDMWGAKVVELKQKGVLNG